MSVCTLAYVCVTVYLLVWPLCVNNRPRTTSHTHTLEYTQQLSYSGGRWRTCHTVLVTDDSTQSDQLNQLGIEESWGEASWLFPGVIIRTWELVVLCWSRPRPVSKGTHWRVHKRARARTRRWQLARARACVHVCLTHTDMCIYISCGGVIVGKSSFAHTFEENIRYTCTRSHTRTQVTCRAPGSCSSGELSSKFSSKFSSSSSVETTFLSVELWLKNFFEIKIQRNENSHEYHELHMICRSAYDCVRVQGFCCGCCYNRWCCCWRW